MSIVSLAAASQQLETLTEEERRALRGSKFAALPPKSADPSDSCPRLAHPGGALATNKVSALAKFLKRKLESGPVSLDPDLVERAVHNAKASIKPASKVPVRHVDTFSDSEEDNKAANFYATKQTVNGHIVGTQNFSAVHTKGKKKKNKAGNKNRN